MKKIYIYITVNCCIKSSILYVKNILTNIKKSLTNIILIKVGNKKNAIFIFKNLRILFALNHIKTNKTLGIGKQSFMEKMYYYNIHKNMNFY